MARLDQVAPPSLPLSKAEYTAFDGNQYSNVLRLFFTRLLGSFNTLVGSIGGQFLEFPYGMFSSDANQTTTGANTPTLVAINTEDYAVGMYHDVGDGVHVEQSGMYNFQFSIQLENLDTGVHDVDIWLKKNGSNLAATGSRYSVPSKHGSVHGHLIAVANFYVSLNAGDYIELWWAAASTQVQLEAYTASASPYSRPAIPSAVVTLSFVSGIG